jgi:hypothetical protein
MQFQSQHEAYAMKFLRATIVLLALFSSFTNARPPSPEQHLVRLSEQLNLSSDQQQQIEQILQQEQSQRSDLAAQYGIDENFHKQMRQLHQQSAADIETVLNDEQLQKFQAMRKQREQSRQGKGK